MLMYSVKAMALGGLALLITACASTSKYQTMQMRLQQQADTIVVLDQRLKSAGSSSERQQLLALQQVAMDKGIALLKEAQAQKLAVNKECMARERSIPDSAKTCYEESSLEETQATLMVMLLEREGRDRIAE